MPTSLTTRADLLAVAQHLASSRSQAQRLIAEGLLQWSIEQGEWRTVTKANQSLSTHCCLRLQHAGETQYVSRGGVKLAAAIQHTHMTVCGQRCLDIGQSTGGFTDCLLQHGAAHVVGVDVGHDQLHPRLRGDARVTCLEKINARQLPVSLLDHNQMQPFAVAVMDVSFISQTLLLPSLAPLLANKGHLLALVKPQFEATPDAIGKNGLIKHPSTYAHVEQRIKQAWIQTGFVVQDYFPSAITGGDGNHEFFILVQKR